TAPGPSSDDDAKVCPAARELGHGASVTLMRSSLFSVLGALCALSCTCSRTADDGAPTSRFSPEYIPGAGQDAGLRRTDLQRARVGEKAPNKSAPASKRCRLGVAQQTIRALGTAVSEGDF